MHSNSPETRDQGSLANGNAGLVPPFEPPSVADFIKARDQAFPLCLISRRSDIRPAPRFTAASPKAALLRKDSVAAGE